MNVKHLDHLNMSVRNLDETEDWYKRVFGFEIVESGLRSGMKWAIMKSGEALLCIYEYPNLAKPDKVSDHSPHTINHFGLRITDRSKWQETINRERVRVLYGGEVRYPSSTSWYVIDPTGYEIEVALWDQDQVSFGEASIN
ncbi:MAG: VOC family protein [Candidatus Obscuribacterales bacterium]|nr:VOC family protein [Candidatus Obscuribacterales bacterium]